MADAGQDVFMVCPKCRILWRSRDAMLEDPRVRVRYFHPLSGSHRSGLFIFSHQTCGTNFALDLSLFNDLSHYALLAVSDCSLGAATEFCIAAQNRLARPPLCSCRAVWNVLRAIQLWPKKLGAD